MGRTWRVLTALLMSSILLAAPLYTNAEETDGEGIPAAGSGNIERPMTGEGSNERQDAGFFSMPEATTPSSLRISQAEQDESTVYDEAGLAKWCEANASTGGTVTLGANITITSNIFVGGSCAIIIDTGAFGLAYDGGSIVAGRLCITGEGVDVPVLDVINPNAFRMNWIHIIQPLHITAAGRDGVGGTALRISQADDTWLPNFDFFLTEGLIRSYGAGAVGVELAIPLDVYCLNIKTEGDGSIAVRVPDGSKLYYCKLSASGSGAAAVGGGDIVLDCCAVSPAPQENNVIVTQRRVIDVSGSRLYQPVRQNSDFVECEELTQFLLITEDGALTTQMFFVQWDYNKINGINLRELGRTTVAGRLAPPFEGLGLTEEFPLELVVDVRDPSVPCIDNISFVEYDDLKFARLDFWKSDEWETGDLILWRSDDDGATWDNYTDSGDIERLNGAFAFHYTQITDPILFQLEVPGFGESNIAALYSTDGQVRGGDGGDRAGGDRVISTKPDNAPPENPPGSPWNNDSPSNDSPQNGDSPSGDNDTGNGQSLGDDLVDGKPPVPAVSPTRDYEPDSGSTPQPPAEWENENGIGISGKRLAALLMVYPEAVPFVKKGVGLAVSSTALRELRVSDHQLFSVEIIKEQNTFTVSFRVDRKLIESLPAIANIEGLTISLTGSGTYEIKADDEKPTEAKPAAPETTVPDTPAKPTGNKQIPMGNSALQAELEQTQTGAEREPMPAVTEVEKTAPVPEPTMKPAVDAMLKKNLVIRDTSAGNAKTMALPVCFAAALFVVGAAFGKRIMKR